VIDDPKDDAATPSEASDWYLDVYQADTDPAPMIDPDSTDSGESADPGEDADVAPQEADKKRSMPFWMELPILIGVALVVAVIIKTFLFQAFFIPSGSMKETLQVDDRVLVSKVSYTFGDLAYGDVIVFDDPRGGFESPTDGVGERAIRNLLESVGLATPESEFIKRVVGLPGDSVELVQNQLFVNGVRVDEPYLAADAVPPSTCAAGGHDYGPQTIPEGHVMVMGDNRCHSSDGRRFGPVPEGAIVGKAFIIIWPPSRWSGL
jgi:signal peptidase I